MAGDGDWGAGLTSRADLMTPTALRCAATFRLADHIQAGLTTVDELAKVIADDLTLRELLPSGATVVINQILLEATLGRLVFAGVLTEEAGLYGLTEVGRLLLDDHVDQLRARLDVRHPSCATELTVVDLLPALLGAPPPAPLVELLRAAPVPLGPLPDIGLATPLCVRVAATLRLADRLLTGVDTVDSLAQVIAEDQELRVVLPPGTTVAVDHVLLAAVLGRLVEIGAITEDAGRYQLTDPARILCQDHPLRVRDWLDVRWPIGRGDLSLVRLPAAVLAGTTTFGLRHGRTFWEDLAADATRADRFGVLMRLAQQAADASAVVDRYAWGELGSVLDIGGGEGSLLIELLGAYPGLRGAVLELPGPVAAAATAAVRAAGLADRAEVLTGTFFDELPAGYGGYLLAAILQDWPDEQAVAILRRCAAAAGRHGTVFVIEGWGHGQGADIQTTMALRLAALFGGRERTVEEFAVLARAANLTVTETIRTTHRMVLVMTTDAG